jgi:hypothetical protein
VTLFHISKTVCAQSFFIDVVRSFRQMKRQPEIAALKWDHGRTSPIFFAHKVESDFFVSKVRTDPMLMLDETGNVIETHEHAAEFKER